MLHGYKFSEENLTEHFDDCELFEVIFYLINGQKQVVEFTRETILDFIEYMTHLNRSEFFLIGSDSDLIALNLNHVVKIELFQKA